MIVEASSSRRGASARVDVDEKEEERRDDERGAR